jgi:phosphinothricin acetyltransferase
VSGVTIRPATSAHAVPVAEIYAPLVRETIVSFETEAPDSAEMARRIEASLASHAWFVAEESGQVLGYAYGTQHRTRAAYRWSVDVSCYVRGAAHRRGVGRALYLKLFERLAARGYRAAHAGIALPNDASVAFHEALGFVHVGVYRKVGWKLGAWRDVGWWQRELADRVGEPAEVRLGGEEPGTG